MRKKKSLETDKRHMAHIAFRAGLPIEEIASLTEASVSSIEYNIKKHGWEKNGKSDPFLWLSSISMLIDKEIASLLIKNELDSDTKNNDKIRNLANLIKAVDQLQELQVKIKNQIDDIKNKSLSQKDKKLQKIDENQIREEFKEQLLKVLFKE